jgi:hypothetical protein
MTRYLVVISSSDFSWIGELTGHVNGIGKEVGEVCNE